MVVFLFATGLTLVFGILRVLNFAHGGLFMIGAYLAFSLSRVIGGAEMGLARLSARQHFWPASGWVSRTGSSNGVFRPLQQVDEAYSLIATYALLLICEGAVKAIWGVNFHSVPTPATAGGRLVRGRRRDARSTRSSSSPSGIALLRRARVGAAPHRRPAS